MACFIRMDLFLVAVLTLLSISSIQGQNEFTLNGRQFNMVFQKKTVSQAQTYCADTFGTELAEINYRTELDAVHEQVKALYEAAGEDFRQLWVGGKANGRMHGKAPIEELSPNGRWCLIASKYSGPNKYDSPTFNLFRKNCGIDWQFLCATPPMRFKLEERYFEIILDTMNAGDANVLCHDRYGTDLAVVNNRWEMDEVYAGTQAEYDRVGQQLREVWLGTRTFGDVHGGADFTDFNNEGDKCTIASTWGTGSWDAGTFDVYIKVCSENRPFLCATAAPMGFTVNDRHFQIVLARKNAADANSYCQERAGTELAVIRDEAELNAVSEQVISSFDRSDITLKELLLGMHTNKANNALTQFSEVVEGGARCVIGSVWQSAGSWISPNLRLFSKPCTAPRQFLCATPPPPAPLVPVVVATAAPPVTQAPTLPPGTEHRFTLPGTDRDYIAFLVDPEHVVNSQTGAFGYCQGQGMRLAQVRSQETLDELSTALMSIRTQTGQSLGEIVTGERVTGRPNALVEVDRLSPSGWACASLVEADGAFDLFAKRCAQQRGVLCEEIPSC